MQYWLNGLIGCDDLNRWYARKDLVEFFNLVNYIGGNNAN